MPVNPPAPPEPKRVQAGRVLKNHSDAVILVIGVVLGAAIALVATLAR